MRGGRSLGKRYIFGVASPKGIWFIHAEVDRSNSTDQFNGFVHASEWPSNVLSSSERSVRSDANWPWGEAPDADARI